MLNDVKIALRISHSALDSEITDLIAACRVDLILAGVKPAKANDNNDAAVRMAIKTYCKAHFGYDNPDADRLLEAYNQQKYRLTLAGDYR